MKCIRLNDGKIDRVKDDKAEQLVADGKATYTNKKEWKIATGRWKPEEKA
jgi:hypothetical protein